MQFKKILDKSKLWIGILFGILFLYLALQNTNFEEFLSAIKTIKLIPVFIIILLRIFALLIRGFRWRIILEPVKEISTIKLFRITSIGEMGNYLLPARFGEIMRVFIVANKEKISKSAVFASVVADRIFDFISVIIVFFLISIFVTIPNFSQNLHVLAAIASIILILSFFILFKLPPQLPFLEFLPENLVKKVNDALQRFRGALSGLNEPCRIIKLLTTSLFIWILNIASFHLVIIALDLSLIWYYSSIVVVIIALGMILPSSPGYVGTYEFFCVASLTFFAIEKNSALACAVISHGLLYIVIIVVGFSCYIFENIPIGRIISSKQQEENV